MKIETLETIETVLFGVVIFLIGVTIFCLGIACGIAAHHFLG